MQRIRYRYGFGGSSSSHFPRGVKWLLIINIALFLLYFFAVRLRAAGFFSVLGLSPVAVLGHGAIWQLFTYMFLHDPIGIFHVLFNMFALWMFGSDLERDWGTRRFLKYYFLCGIGAGLCDVAANAIAGNWYTRTIGASGAIYGLLLAFGLMYPDRIVLFSFLFPIKAKYFVMILGAIAFLYSVSGTNSGVSNVAHLGGMVFGYLYLRAGFLRSRFSVFGTMRREYQNWKIQRARRKFQVYLRKHGPDRDRRVH
jgi:membrane associated rhomboid family serine protease